MMTSGQMWVTRRLDDIIEMVEEAAGDIDTQDYPNFDTLMMDVFDSALNRAQSPADGARDLRHDGTVLHHHRRQDHARDLH